MLNFLNQQKNYKTITSKEAKDLILKHKNDSQLVILDVRTPAEFADSKIDQNAININVQDQYFEARIKELNLDKTILVYCRSGGRSSAACQILDQLGFKNIYNLQGGIGSWM